LIAGTANTNKSTTTDTTNPTEDDMFDDFGGLEPTTIKVMVKW
jgi:hypothetical protein